MSTADNILKEALTLKPSEKADIKKMSITERLQAMEALWDSILYDDNEIESPDWHEQILEERKRKITEGDVKFISLTELKSIRKS